MKKTFIVMLFGLLSAANVLLVAVTSPPVSLAQGASCLVKARCSSCECKDTCYTSRCTCVCSGTDLGCFADCGTGHAYLCTAATAHCPPTGGGGTGGGGGGGGVGSLCTDPWDPWCEFIDNW